ncbi:MAG: TetR/AcrR family transcriptional regulator [Bacteroidetes bacterium]|nr:TetR/AcrR family transcriptional regulator [Bacteroidota bacterium]
MSRPVSYDRADVLDRAMRLFWRRGFEAVTLQDILDETGFNRHSLYKEFGDKDGLFTQALEQYEKMSSMYVASPLESDDGGLDAIRNLFAMRLRADVDGIGCLLTNSIIERNLLCDRAVCAVDRFIARFEAALLNAIQVAQRQGTIPSEKDPSALARYLLTVIQGLGTLSKVGMSAEESREIMEQTLTFLTIPFAVA